MNRKAVSKLTLPVALVGLVSIVVPSAHAQEAGAMGMQDMPMMPGGMMGR